MDLSGMIFVALAIGWAVYLLPKALRHHDEEDRRRSVEEFSDSVRVVGRASVLERATVERATVVERSAVVGSGRASVIERSAVVESARASVVEPAETPAARPQTLTRQAAREAARRRRRVLVLLVSMLALVMITSALSYTPWFTTAIPTVLIVGFLVIARLTVRAQQAVRRTAPVQHATDEAPAAAVEVEAELDTEDTQGLSRDELAEVVGEPVLDEGGLWDPLPVTLPTYVNKARARRTVRTIELTAAATGVTSSGHDASDTALAREAAALQAEALQAELQAEVEAEVDVVEAPKAAGA